MRKSLQLLTIAAVLGAMSPLAAQESVPVYKNTNYSFQERAVDLVSRLTLEEKQALLGNSMAGTLHKCVFTPGLNHLCKKLIKFYRVRSSMLCWICLAFNVIAHGRK